MDKRQSWVMFNRIAKTYDTSNRVLSLGIDRYWRRRLVDTISKEHNQAVLDLGTGTGDVAIMIRRRRPNVTVIAVDPAQSMLSIGEHKSAGDAGISWTLGAGEAIPIEHSMVDHVTMAFALRNVPDLAKTIDEIYRVLKPGGRFSILEFSLPTIPIVRTVYLLYFRHILPILGGMLSGDREAYSYLNTSVEAFPYGEALLNVFTKAGFARCSTQSLSGGIAMIYQGEKP